MWCSACNQEVPVVAVRAAKSDAPEIGETANRGGAIVCARCRHVIDSTTSRWSRIDDAHSPAPLQDEISQVPQERSEASQNYAPPTEAVWNDTAPWIDGSDGTATDDGETTIEAVQATDFDPRFGDDLSMDHDLLRAKVALNSYRTDTVHDVSWTRRRPTHNGPSDIECANDAPRPDRRASRWWTVSVGISIFTFGSVLAIGSAASGSVAAGHERLWHIGMPACLIGQTFLIIALALQLERLCKSHRQTQVTLARLQEMTGQLARESNETERVKPARQHT